MNGRRRLLGSFNHGSMANALPQAIGAQAQYPGRQVVHVGRRRAGDVDGGAAFAAAVETAGEGDRVQERRSGIRGAGNEGGRDPRFRHRPGQSDFARIADAAGLFGARVEKADELEDALQERSPTMGRPWSTSAPPARNSRCHPSSATARLRASPCTQPGPSCPERATSSSNSPAPTCGNWTSNNRPAISRHGRTAGSEAGAPRGGRPWKTTTSADPGAGRHRSEAGRHRLEAQRRAGCPRRGCFARLVSRRWPPRGLSGLPGRSHGPDRRRRRRRR